MAKKVAGDCGYVPLRDLPVFAMDEARGWQSFGRGFQEDQRVMAVLRLHHGHDAAETGMIFQQVAHFGGEYFRFYLSWRPQPCACRAKRCKGQRIKKRAIGYRRKAQPLIQLAGFGRGREIGKDFVLIGGRHLQHARGEPAAGRLHIPAGQVDDDPAGLRQTAFDRQQNACGIVALHQQLPDRAEFAPLVMFADERQPARPEGLAFFREAFRQKSDGGDAVSVVDRYDFQGRSPQIWRRSGRGGIFNSTA